MTDGEITSWAGVVDFMNETCPTCGNFLNNSPDCDPVCVTLQPPVRNG